MDERFLQAVGYLIPDTSSSQTASRALYCNLKDSLPADDANRSQWSARSEIAAFAHEDLLRSPDSVSIAEDNSGRAGNGPNCQMRSISSGCEAIVIVLISSLCIRDWNAKLSDKIDM